MSGGIGGGGGGDAGWSAQETGFTQGGGAVDVATLARLLRPPGVVWRSTHLRDLDKGASSSASGAGLGARAPPSLYPWSSGSSSLYPWYDTEDFYPAASLISSSTARGPLARFPLSALCAACASAACSASSFQSVGHADAYMAALSSQHATANFSANAAGMAGPAVSVMVGGTEWRGWSPSVPPPTCEACCAAVRLPVVASLETGGGRSVNSGGVGSMGGGGRSTMKSGGGRGSSSGGGGGGGGYVPPRLAEANAAALFATFVISSSDADGVCVDPRPPWLQEADAAAAEVDAYVYGHGSPAGGPSSALPPHRGATSGPLALADVETALAALPNPVPPTLASIVAVDDAVWRAAHHRVAAAVAQWNAWVAGEDWSYAASFAELLLDVLRAATK